MHMARILLRPGTAVKVVRGELTGRQGEILPGSQLMPGGKLGYWVLIHYIGHPTEAFLFADEFEVTSPAERAEAAGIGDWSI